MVMKKKVALERELKAVGCEFVGAKGKHEIWRNPKTGKNVTIPHGDIKTRWLLNKIYKQAGIE